MIVATVGLFVLSVVMFKFVPQQFFPASGRLELMIDLKLAEGASLTNTAEQVKRLEQMLKDHQGIDNYVAYVGTGSPRFYLPLDQQLPAPSFAQFVVLARSIEDREAIRGWLISSLNEQFPTLRSRVTRLENGPPVGYPVQFRVTGEHIEVVRALARKVQDRVRENPHVANVHLDWEEPSKVVHLNIDQDRARALGVTTADLSAFLRNSLTGSSVSQFRDDDELIDILLRGTRNEREQLGALSSLAIPTQNGTSVALSQVATLDYGFEEGVIWHRNRLPSVTVRADIYGKGQPATLVKQILPTLDSVRAELPDGYLLEVGGTVEDSARGQNSVNAGMPLFIVVVLTLLMIQLRSFSRMLMVFITAPLAADRRHAVPADLQSAVRLCGHAGHHRAVRNDHAQFGDSGRSDRAGHHRRAGPMARDHRCHRAPLPPDRADCSGRSAGDDTAVTQPVFRPDGRGYHGWSDRRHGADPAVPARAVCRVVQGETGG
ncbi:RND efflux transporter [Pseudomonas avellanae BPIC 631]|nr:RND efflux transporter [Pseudomonas avellanae BPIC 631]